MFSKATLKQILLKEFLRIIFSRRFRLFTSSFFKKFQLKQRENIILTIGLSYAASKLRCAISGDTLEM